MRAIILVPIFAILHFVSMFLIVYLKLGVLETSISNEMSKDVLLAIFVLPSFLIVQSIPESLSLPTVIICSLIYGAVIHFSLCFIIRSLKRIKV